MEELSKLSKLIIHTLNLSRVLPVGGRNSKENKFIENLVHDKYTDDAQAANDIYNSDSKDVRYKMLKHRTKKRLYNNLLFLDPISLSLKDFVRMEQECFMFLHQAYILKRQYEFDLVLNLANKAFRIAMKYDFSDIVVAALELKAFCLSELGLKHEFLSCSNQLKESNEKLFFEKKSIVIFQDINVNLKQTTRKRQNYLSCLPESIKQLELLWDQAQTFSSFDAYYKSSIFYYELTGEFDAIISMTKKSLIWLDMGKINRYRFDELYNKFILVYAHLRSRNINDGLKYASLYVNDFNTNSFNWFPYMENYFLLALHAKEYDLGHIIIDKVSKNTTFNKVSKSARERWMLYRSYLSIISASNFGENNPINPFLMPLPEYSKDKQGFNVAILILQFIYYLQKNDAEALLYRIESLKKYILTHLKETFSLRSKIFLKMLILTVTEDFDAKICRDKGQKLYQKLLDTPAPGDAFAEIEIIPYEHLWEHILCTLENSSK